MLLTPISFVGKTCHALVFVDQHFAPRLLRENKHAIITARMCDGDGEKGFGRQKLTHLLLAISQKIKILTINTSLHS